MQAKLPCNPWPAWRPEGQESLGTDARRVAAGLDAVGIWRYLYGYMGYIQKWFLTMGHSHQIHQIRSPNIVDSWKDQTVDTLHTHAENVVTTTRTITSGPTTSEV